MKKEIKNILQYTDIKGNSLEKYFRKPLKNKKTDGLNLSFKPSVPGGEGGIRTLAPVSRPTPLAGAPLRPA